MARSVTPRTVFLCIPSGTAAANLLRTDVFRLLRESPLIGRLVILSPLVREAGVPRRVLRRRKSPSRRWSRTSPASSSGGSSAILQEKYVKTMPTESMRIRVARERQLENGRETRYLDRGGLGAPKTKRRPRGRWPA